jgi:hypothetical protein
MTGLCGWLPRDRPAESDLRALREFGAGLLLRDALSVVGPLRACDVLLYLAADELCEESLIQVQGPLGEQNYRAVVAASGQVLAVPA